VDAEFGSGRLDGMTFDAEEIGLSLGAGRGFGAEGSIIANDPPIRCERPLVGGDELFRCAGDNIEEDAGHEGAGAIGVVSSGEAFPELREGEQGTLSNAADFLGDEGRSRQEQLSGGFGVIDDLRFHVGAEFDGPGCAGCFHSGPRGRIRVVVGCRRGELTWCAVVRERGLGIGMPSYGPTTQMRPAEVS